jgi:hypothetical protein
MIAPVTGALGFWNVLAALLKSAHPSALSAPKEIHILVTENAVVEADGGCSVVSRCSTRRGLAVR